MVTKTEKVKVKTPVRKETTLKSGVLTVDVFDMKGEKVGETTLPKEIFGREKNDQLLAQAVRGYLANQHSKGGETKTRSQVAGGGAKPWRQKGTGRARAGSIRSPLWRGGGIIHGPHKRDFGLSLPKKMRRAALASALSAKATSKDIAVLSKLELSEPKTKLAAKVVGKLPIKENSLLVVEENKNLQVAFKNLKRVELVNFQDLNTYQVLAHQSLVFTKSSLEALEGFFTKNVN